MKKQLLVLVSVLALTGGTVYACQPKEVDVCSNIEGTQVVVPDGDTVSDGVCTAIPPVTPPIDVAPPGAPVVPPAPDVDNSTPPQVQGFVGK